MIKKLRGNTRTITWTLLTNGQATSLVGMDLTLELVSPSGAHKPMPYTVSGNTLTTTWQGKEQKECGEYSLVLWDNRNHDGQAIAKRDRFIELIDEGKETTNGTIIDNSPSGGGSVNIEDNLTSYDPNSALSANQGRVLKGMVDAKQDILTTYTDNVGSTTTISNRYVVFDCDDAKVNNNSIATKTYVDTSVYNKADREHTHNIADVTGLQNALDAKASVTSVPTKTSQLANDSGYLTSSAMGAYETSTHAQATYQLKGNYLTEHQSLSGYATTSVTSALDTRLSAVEAYIQADQELADI